MTKCQIDDDPFADAVDDGINPFEEWGDLPGDNPTDSIRLDALEVATAADPFATSRLDDCPLAFRVGPSPFDRYQVAHRAYMKSANDDDDTPETTEIHRLIALYWLARSRSILVD